MNDCGAKSKLPAPLIYLSKTGNYRRKKDNARQGEQTRKRLTFASIAATALGLAALPTPASAIHQWFEEPKNWTGDVAFYGTDP
jgi:hypothetical protein